MSDTLKTTTPVCSFCGRTAEEVDRIIAGPDVYICNECIEVCENILVQERRQAKKRDLKKFDIPVPKEIKKYLDEYVIGQLDAKIALAVAVITTSALWIRKKMRLNFRNLILLC